MQPLGGSAAHLQGEGGRLAGSAARLSNLPPCLGHCPNAPSWMRTDMWNAVAWLAMTNLQRSSPGELSSFSPLPSRPLSSGVDPSPSTATRSTCISSLSGEEEEEEEEETVKAKRKRDEVEEEGEEEGREASEPHAVVEGRERGVLREGAASRECAPRTKRGRNTTRRYAFHHRLNELKCVAPQRVRDGRRTVQRKAESAPLWNFVQQNFGIIDGRAVRKTGNGELLFKADVANM